MKAPEKDELEKILQEAWPEVKIRVRTEISADLLRIRKKIYVNNYFLYEFDPEILQDLQAFNNVDATQEWIDMLKEKEEQIQNEIDKKMKEYKAFLLNARNKEIKS